MKKVKTAVVGLNRGGILAKHILDYVKKLDLISVCDIDKAKADKFALDNKIESVYYSIDDLLKTDVEAIIFATPIPDHPQHVIAALNADKHVLSEVTSGITIDECKKIAEAVKKSGKKYMLEENYCYYRPITIVHNMIKSGLLGDIYYAESDYLMDFQLRPGFPAQLQNWRKEVYFGRRGHPYITHSLGPLSFLMNDKIKTVTCMGAGKFEDLVADRTCVLMCQTEKGGMIRLRNSFVSSRPDIYTHYNFQGTKGAYQGSQSKDDYHKIHIRGLMKNDEWRNIYDFKEYLPKEWNLYPDNYFDDSVDTGTDKYDVGAPLLLDAFADCIINDTEPPINADFALNWTAAGILSEESINNGSIPVEIPDFGF